MQVPAIFFMKTIIPLLCMILLLPTCGLEKEKIEVAHAPPVVADHVGKISTHFSEFGCAYLIQLEENNQPTLLCPVNLPDDFRVAELKIRFQYREADNAGACELGRPVVLDKIERLNP